LIASKNIPLTPKIQRWWVVLYLVIMFVGIWSAFFRWAYDDPYITYRYAANIASDIGFVYNPGERVLSTTTPLFAVILAFFHKIGFSIPIVANAISILSLAVGGLLIWDLSRSWKTSWVGWAGLLLYPTFSLLFSTVGSETPLYLALCLGSFALYARKQIAWTAIMIALATLTRFDGILVAFIIGTNFLWQNRSDLRDISFWSNLPWKGFIVAIGLLLGWHLYSWYYFGSPFPATLAAKQAQGAMAISTRFAPGLLRIAGWFASWPYWLELGLVVLGCFYAITRKSRWLIVLGWVGLYFLAYTILGVSSYYWYYAPLVPGWIISLGLGLSLIDQLPLPSQINTHALGTYLQPLIVIFLLSVLFLAQLSNLNQLRQIPDARFPIYRAAGIWLAENTPDDVSVGALEVGIIGFFAQRQMIDFAGLIQPDVAKVFNRNSTYEDSALWAVNEYRPDFLVLFSGAFPSLVEDYVDESCVLTRRLSVMNDDLAKDLLIFDCRK
jgi:hypothetical protein